MKTSVVIFVLTVLVSATMSSPILKEKMDERYREVKGDKGLQEAPLKIQNSKLAVEECFIADCNVSCWQQGHIGGRCTIIGREETCECY